MTYPALDMHHRPHGERQSTHKNWFSVWVKWSAALGWSSKHITYRYRRNGSPPRSSECLQQQHQPASVSSLFHPIPPTPVILFFVDPSQKYPHACLIIRSISTSCLLTNCTLQLSHGRFSSYTSCSSSSGSRWKRYRKVRPIPCQRSRCGWRTTALLRAKVILCGRVNQS